MVSPKAGSSSGSIEAVTGDGREQVHFEAVLFVPCLYSAFFMRDEAYTIMKLYPTSVICHMLLITQPAALPSQHFSQCLAQPMYIYIYPLYMHLASLCVRPLHTHYRLPRSNEIGTFVPNVRQNNAEMSKDQFYSIFWSKSQISIILIVMVFD